MNTPIADFLDSYKKSGTARFHMPGHKGKNGFDFDITEVYGADELYAADGIIEASENNASRLFGSAHSYYSTEGSTLAIKAMLTLAATEKPTGEKPLFVVGRNIHKSFVYGAAMLDAEVRWAGSDGKHICRCDLTPSMIEEEIKACHRKPDGVYITSPDYLGNMADVAGIAHVCDRHEIPLLVDNAHGAYLAFLDESLHPLALGASMCADSAHKTLPVLTGGAYLHVAEKAKRFCASARAVMATYASTSPSYLILRSLDECNGYLSDSDGKELRRACEYVKQARMDLAKRNIVTEGDEPLKLVINAAASGYEGDELAAIFREAGIEPEFCDSDYAVLMINEFNTQEELDRLDSVLSQLNRRPAILRGSICLGNTLRAMSIRDAVLAPSEFIPTELAEGRICASPAISCPPAVPIAVSGEVISADCVKALLRYGITKISVVKK